jgi:hypothetical protein
MASLTWSQAILTLTQFNPLVNWQYQYVPFGGGIQILHRATAVGLVCTVTNGSDTMQERSPVPAGGTAGSIPSAFDVPAISGLVAAGDFLKIAYDNPTAGTITVDGVINYD